MRFQIVAATLLAAFQTGVANPPGGASSNGSGATTAAAVGAGPAVSHAASAPAVHSAPVAARAPSSTTPAHVPPAVGTAPAAQNPSVSQGVHRNPNTGWNHGQYDPRRTYYSRAAIYHDLRPGGYYPATAPYGYPSLYVQSYGYPYSSLPLGAADGGEYYFGDPGTDSMQPAPAQPQATPNSDNQPDELVHAVQAELARRGYFAGQVDGLVTKDFQTALRRFQNDLQLAPSGLINQATLYALGLN